MINDELYGRYFTTLLQGDVRLCAATVSNLLDRNIEIPEIYTEHFPNSLYPVGELWELNWIL